MRVLVHVEVQPRCDIHEELLHQRVTATVFTQSVLGWPFSMCDSCYHQFGADFGTDCGPDDTFVYAKKEPLMGTTTTVQVLPECDICRYVKNVTKVTAHYDGKTTLGPWANMCDECFEEYGVGLGTGRGQKLILADTNK